MFLLSARKKDFAMKHVEAKGKPVLARATAYGFTVVPPIVIDTGRMQQQQLMVAQRGFLKENRWGASTSCRLTVHTRPALVSVIPALSRILRGLA